MTKGVNRWNVLTFFGSFLDKLDLKGTGFACFTEEMGLKMASTTALNRLACL